MDRQVRQRTQAEANRRISNVVRISGADRTNVKRLIEVAGLDPASDFRFENWSGVDFSGVDLAGFDFTGARLHGCDFSGARISGARFDQAELGRVLHRAGRDPDAPAEITPIADLRGAADWVEHAESWKAGAPTSDAHLPVGAIFQDAPFGPELVVVPAGEFMTGSTHGRNPLRQVNIASPFAVGRFAINTSETRAVRSNRAVTLGNTRHDLNLIKRSAVSTAWKRATDYCTRLSTVTGKPYRLLSEAEWEYCCLAGKTMSFWQGQDISEDHQKYKRLSEISARKRGRPLLHVPTNGAHEPNPWGILFPPNRGMLEWCADRFHDASQGVPADGSAWTSGKTDERVVRGGSHRIHPDILRSHFRFGLDPDLLHEGVGFRVARTLSTT